MHFDDTFVDILKVKEKCNIASVHTFAVARQSSIHWTEII